MCGENLRRRSIQTQECGSPPRMRGKLFLYSSATGRCGIPPAHAGKTGNAKPLCCESRDHPRACGENRTMPLLVRKAGDHPRVCGENGALPVRHVLMEGSPPRVRGKLQAVPRGVLCERITPACAGKTACRQRLSARGKDHPRVCGENFKENQHFMDLTGSPPRVRGKLGR